MQTFTQRIASGSPAAVLRLPFELRQRSRLRTFLETGEEIGIFLPRGSVLRDGDLLRSEEGVVLVVRAATEKVSRVSSDDRLLISRACYHLGNRHVPLQIGDGWLRYERDHVLDDMLRNMDLVVTWEDAPFEPEAGAYDHYHAPNPPVIAGLMR